MTSSRQLERRTDMNGWLEVLFITLGLMVLVYLVVRVIILFSARLLGKTCAKLVGRPAAWFKEFRKAYKEAKKE
jgi:hypothetical protein